MSDAKRCDICGCFYVTGKVNWSIWTSKHNTDANTDIDERYDICLDCLKNKIYPLIPSSEMLKEEFGNV